MSGTNRHPRNQLVSVRSVVILLITLYSPTLSVGTDTNVLDLSYHHNVNVDVFAMAIRQKQQQQQNSPSNLEENQNFDSSDAESSLTKNIPLILRRHSPLLRIDLSNSVIGDDGLVSLLKDLFPKIHKHNQTMISSGNKNLDLFQPEASKSSIDERMNIHLALRMNQLSQVGVTELFQAIRLGPTNGENITRTNTHNQSHQETTNSLNDKVAQSGIEVAIKEDDIQKKQPLNRPQPSTTISNKNDPNYKSSLKWYVESLDLSWNDLSSSSSSKSEETAFYRSLNQLVADSWQCPRILRFDLCGLGPAACRAIGKGIIKRFDHVKTNKDPPKTLLTLHLSGNEALGDAGAATLAAAIRSVVMKKMMIKHTRPEPSMPSSSSKTSSSLSDATTHDSNDDDDEMCLVLDKLNLSACSIGDAGVEALSLALECHPRCLRALDLSNNRITDLGVTALGQALQLHPRQRRTSEGTTHHVEHTRFFGLEELDLSNNVDIGDRGATVLAECLASNNVMTKTKATRDNAGRNDNHHTNDMVMIRNIALRSCNIRADGAAAFGRALRHLCRHRPHSSYHDKKLLSSRQLPSVDFSGNALGILRGKGAGSGKSNGGKYSASHLKSKASATTASYMNFIGKKIRAGLKDVVGVDVMGVDNKDEDEDDDDVSSKDKSSEMASNFDAVEARCGVKALVNAFLEDEGGYDDEEEEEEGDDENRQKTRNNGEQRRQCHIGLRRCFLDHAAADALAAMVLDARDKWDLDLHIDVSLNSVLEDEMVTALQRGGGGDENDLYYLREMAERYHKAVSALKQAEQRVKEAATAASTRRVNKWAEADEEVVEEEEEWEAPMVQGQETWDSDAEYDDDDE